MIECNVTASTVPHVGAKQDASSPTTMAGVERSIWTECPDGKSGSAIITEPARGASNAIQPRMLLALDAESLEPWLDPDMTECETIRNVVHHLDAKLITHYPVSTRVNRTGNDEDASLINPA